MKRVLSLIFVMALVMSMTACSIEQEATTQKNTEPSATVPQMQQTEPTDPIPEDDGLDPYVKMLMSKHYYAASGENSTFIYIVFTSSRDDTGYVIIKEYTGEDAVVTIPDMLEGYPVVGMYHSIFDKTPFVSDITFPDSLRTVVFNSNADTDFCMTGTLWYQKQPDGVYYAGNVAVGCKGNGPLTLREGTVGIGGNAFKGRKDLTTIEFPESLRMIADDAFAGSGLTQVTIPTTLQYYFGAFGSCYRLERVVFEEGITEITGTVSGSSVKEVVLPESLVTIGDKAFMRCEELQSITLPAGVKTIGEAAFYGSGLTSVQLNEGLEYIEKEAFYHCKKLKSIYLPASIRSIDIRAVGFTIDDKPKKEFVAYFAVAGQAMENLQNQGVTCQIGTQGEG